MINTSFSLYGLEADGEQNVTGNADEDLVHNKVMAKMISQRGGLENLGWNGTLAWLLSTRVLPSPI